MRIQLLLFFFIISFTGISQKTFVTGTIIDGITGDPMPFVSVRFKDSKIGAFSDTLGHYSFDTYYATDSLVFSYSGYLKVSKRVNLDESQIIDVVLPILSSDYEEVIVKAPDELPSTILHKKVIVNKRINNKA